MRYNTATNTAANAGNLGDLKHGKAKRFSFAETNANFRRLRESGRLAGTDAPTRRRIP